jgi:hypothetical protein
MKRSLKILSWSLALVVLLGVVLAVGAITVSGALDHSHIMINGDTVGADDMSAANWLLAIFGVGIGLVVAFIVLLVVVPLAVLLPLLLVALLLGGALVLVSGIAAVVFSPLLFLVGLGWLIWRLARGPKRSAARTIEHAPMLATADTGAQGAR